MKGLLALLAVLALLALGWLVRGEWSPAQRLGESADPASQSPTPAALDTREPANPSERAGSAKAKGQRAAAGQEASEPPDTEATTLAGNDLGTEVSLDTWREALREEVRASTPRDYERQRTRSRQGDAEAAFWLHLYYYECRRAPREDWQLDQRLASVRQRFADTEDAAGHRDEQINLLLQSYERCAVIGPDVDAYLASLEWLQQAADLGHLGAQRLYHYYGRMLIAQDQSDLIFRRPELIREFQLRADRYAQALLEREHPQGLLLMARMLNVGDVYPKDSVMAYAYARVAEMAFSGELKADAEQRLAWIARDLSPDQLAAAEDKALELAATRAQRD